MWAFLVNPTVRIALRWAFIGILTLIAFWPSLVSLAGATRDGALAGYIWMVPVAAILAAQGVARRPRNELPIHDRQTDIIVGTMGLVFALLVHSVLLQRYALYFHLLRLDFLAMWVFVLSSAIVLFGLRPVARFASVWLLSLMVFALPYHILVVLLGGNKIAAGAATLIIAGAATGIAVGRTSRRGWIGGLAAWAVGLPILAVMGIFFPSAPLWVYTQLPSLTATALVGLAMFLYARRGTTKHPLNRKVEPLAAKQVFAGLPLVLVIAILLALVKLPFIPAPAAARFDGLQLSGPLNPPAGWHITDTVDLSLGETHTRTDRPSDSPAHGCRCGKPAVGQTVSAEDSDGGHRHHGSPVLVQRLPGQGALRCHRDALEQAAASGSGLGCDG